MSYMDYALTRVDRFPFIFEYVSLKDNSRTLICFNKFLD